MTIIKRLTIESFTYWSAILVFLSGCMGGIECTRFSQQNLEKICEGRAIRINPITDSAYKAILKNCLKTIKSESAYAVRSKKKYNSIIDKAKKDELLRKKYEREKSHWEAEEARAIERWRSNQMHSKRIQSKNTSEYNIEGVPPLNITNRITYSSYITWLEKKVFRKEIEATGWNSIASDMQASAEEVKCKE